MVRHPLRLRFLLLYFIYLSIFIFTRYKNSITIMVLVNLLMKSKTLIAFLVFKKKTFFTWLRQMLLFFISPMDLIPKINGVRGYKTKKDKNFTGSGS